MPFADPKRRAAYVKEYRRKRIAAGLCSNCGWRRNGYAELCDYCQEQYNIRKTEQHSRRSNKTPDVQR